MSFLTASRTGSYASRESTRPSFPSIMASENCLAISQQDLGEQVVILLTANGSEVSDIPSAIGEWCRIRSHGSFTPTVPFTGFAGFFLKFFFATPKLTWLCSQHGWDNACYMVGYIRPCWSGWLLTFASIIDPQKESYRLFVSDMFWVQVADLKFWCQVPTGQIHWCTRRPRDP